MKYISPKSLGLLCVVAVPLLLASATREHSRYNESELLLSEYFNLKPAEIKRWSSIRQDGSLQGFVQYQNISVYEVLALHTEDEKELRRLARLFAKHNLQTIRRLKRFEEIYQEEVRNTR